MVFDLDLITAALYDRLKSQPEGASVRALLTAGAAGILPAYQLSPDAVPAGLSLAWRAGVVTGESDQMRDVTGTWWCYDVTDQGYVRIRQLVTAIGRAYPWNAIPLGRTVVTAVGQETRDDPLGRLCRSVTIAYRARG